MFLYLAVSVTCLTCGASRLHPSPTQIRLAHSVSRRAGYAGCVCVVDLCLTLSYALYRVHEQVEPIGVARSGSCHRIDLCVFPHKTEILPPLTLEVQIGSRAAGKLLIDLEQRDVTIQQSCSKTCGEYRPVHRIRGGFTAEKGLNADETRSDNTKQGRKESGAVVCPRVPSLHAGILFY